MVRDHLVPLTDADVLVWVQDECPRCGSRMQVRVCAEDSSVARECPECELIVWLDPAT